MPRKFTPKRIRNVRSSKATVRRPESMMGRGTNITGLDTESLRQRIDTIETPVKASSQAVGDALSGLIPPFQIDDSVIPATNYERSGRYYSPNFTGQETTYVEMHPDEMTRLPRKWRNLINTSLAKNPDNWTQTTAEIKATGTDGVFSVTGLTGGSTIVSFTSDGSEDIADREFLSVCYVKAQTAGQIGKQVNIQADRDSGGTYVSDTVVVTLTNEWQLVSTDAITGLASNLGFRFRVVGAASNVADGCLIKYPNIQEVTNLTNKNPSEPVWGDDSKRELITNGTFSSDPAIPYARLKGQAGSAFSMPSDNLAAHLSDDNTYLRIAARVNSDWNPASNGNIWSFYDFGANDRVILLTVLTSGNLAAYVSANGLFVNDATNRFYGPSVSNFEDKFYWVEFTFDGGTGTFRTSSQQVDTYEEVSRWSAESTSTIPTTSLYTGATVDIVVGANQNSGVFVSPLNGKIARAEVMSRSGELVNVFDAGDWDSNYYLDADHNMLTPAARHDIANEWTQTGTGSVTGASGNQELVNTMVAANWDAQGANTVSDVADGEVQVTYVDNGGGADFKFRFGAGLGAEFDSAPVIGDYYLITGQAKVNTGTVNIRMVGSTVESLAISSTSFVDFAFVSQCNSTTAFRIDMTGMGSGETINVRNISCKPFALDGRTGYGQNTVLNAVKAPVNDTIPRTGIELVPNGDGVNTTGFTKHENSTLVSENNEFKGTAVASWQKILGPPAVLPVDEGEFYIFSYEMRRSTGSAVRVQLTGASGTINNVTTNTSMTPFYHIFKAATNSQSFAFYVDGGGVAYVDNISLRKVDPNYWFRNDGAPSQGANGKLLLSADSGADEQLQRALDLSSYAPGDVLTVSLVTEAQTHDVTLSLTQADQATSQADFTSTAAGRRVWYHVLTQADIDDTSFLSLGATGDAAATATVLDVSIRKFTGCFTVLDDQDNVNSNPRWIYDVTIPNNNQRYSALVTLSQGTAPVTTIRLAPTGVSEDKNRIDYVWATQTLTIVEDDSGNTTASAKQNANGTVTIEISCTDIASNNAISLRLYPAALATSNQGSVNLHSVSLTGANWKPNGNIAMNTDDWEPNSDALIGIYDDELILINTKASVSQAYQEVACRRYVEHTVATDNAGTKRIKFGSSINGTQYADWGSTSGFRSGTITPTAASNFYLTFDSNSGALGNRSRFRLATAQESSYGLGTSRYMNGNTVDGDGVVTIADGLPLHRYEDEQLHDDYAVVPVPGRYKHFTTGEAMKVGNARLPSLANANHPNGGGIYADVAALPNLIDPRARVNFATWTKSGSGDHSSKGIGDGTEIVTSWQAGTTAPDTLEIDGLDLRIVRSTTGTKHVVSQVIPITEGQFYKVRFNLRLNSGSLAAARIKTGTNTSLTTLQPLNEVMTEGLNEHFFWASETDTSARIGFSIASMCDFNISDFEFEEATYSYTQFSDLDTASYKARWENAWDVPADSQKYQVKVRVSKGSNRYQNVRVRVGSGLGERLVIDWQEGNVANHTTAGTAVGAETIDWNLPIGQAVRGEVDVIATITNDAQSSIQIKLYGDWNNAETGTFNVHGEVSLQRISAAAEPTWNTLRPKDSVEQLTLQQQDFNTAWAQSGSPTFTRTLKDVFGVAAKAQTVEDNATGAFEYFRQTAVVVADGSKYAAATFFIHKELTVDCYPAVGLKNSTDSVNHQYTVDPINGLMQLRDSATAADVAFIMDGAVLKSLLPQYANADSFWLVHIAIQDDNCTDWEQQCFPCVAETYTATWASSAVGSNTFDMPQLVYGTSPYPYFFDSIATSATVTEEIQDWSKILTFAAEGDGAQVTQVFTHGHHQLLGAENVTGLTNLSGDPLYASAASSAQWSIAANSFTSQNDAISVIPGQKSAQYVANGTNAYIRDVLTAISGGKETVCCIVEINGGGKCIVRLRDTTISQVYAGCNYVNSTRSSTPQGSSSGAGAVQLGKGPNGGDLVFLWGTGTSANPGNNRNLEVYPNGQSPAVGQDNIIHYAGAFESDIVSILPLDGTRTAHSRWEYDIANLSDEAGTLAVDLISTASSAEMSGNALNNDIIGDSNTLLRMNTQERFVTDDESQAKQIVLTFDGSDVNRLVISWSAAENEHTIRNKNDTGEEEDTTDTSYDGSFGQSEIDVFDGMAYEAFLPSVQLSKEFQNSTERTATAEYHRDD